MRSHRRKERQRPAGVIVLAVATAAIWEIVVGAKWIVVSGSERRRRLGRDLNGISAQAGAPMM
jgi:hypothetical protein